MIDSTKRFSGRVDNYARYRPGYPAAIIDLLRGECGLVKASVVADIGSGTGKLAELFLENGNRVHGVEPNQEMRDAGERLLKRFPNFISVEGTAEATTLAKASVNFITAGQAFHWFDHEQCGGEFLRILKPGGWVVIIWNDRRAKVTPFLDDYEKLLVEFATDYARVRRLRTNDAANFRKFFRTQPYAKSFPNVQQFDFEGLKGRLLSSSYAPAAGQPKHDEMLRALKQIFDAHQRDGEVIFGYDTQVYYGHLD